MAKVALNDYTSPLVTATVILALGAIMFIPLILPDIPGIRQIPKRPVMMFAMAGVATGSAVLAFLFGLERGDVVVVSPLASISTLITLLLAYMFLQRVERVTLPVVLGSIFVVGGSVLVAVGDSLQS